MGFKKEYSLILQRCDLIITLSQLARLIVCFFTFFMLAGCQVYNVREQAAIAGLRSVITEANNFRLQSLQKNTGGPLLIIYIEGDGHAWQSKSRASHDPTPQSPVAFRLALLDPRHDVAYLARPCQYLVDQPACRDNRWWTDDRFSEPVIAAMNSAIDQLKQSPRQKIELIGFSGGGAIAIDIAARRSDIAAIRTIAGNLDPHLLNQLHGVTPMPTTIDPMQFAPRLRAVPQIHYTGTDDDIVTSAVTLSYLQAAGNPACVHSIAVKVSHNDGWEESWPQLLEQKPDCR